MQIWTFCHFCHQNREFDVTLMHDMWIMCFTTGTFQIAKSRKHNHMKFFVIHQNDIKSSFLMIKVTKYQNLLVDTFNNTKYRFLWKLTMFLHLWKNWYKISHYINFNKGYIFTFIVIILIINLKQYEPKIITKLRSE